MPASRWGVYALGRARTLPVQGLFALIVYGPAALLLSTLIDWLTQRLATLRRRELATAAGALR